MPHPRKYIEHGALYLVTSRTEEGLPFANQAAFQPLFRAIIARAQNLYPVHIVAFCLMANHFHLLLSPINPEHFPLFVGYLKQELAHAVNRRQRRRQRTIWTNGYDSPLILDYQSALHYLCYLYTQAQSANLVDTVEDFGQGSSWQMFVSASYAETHERVLRTSHNEGATTEMAPVMESHSLTLSPYVWLKRLAPERTEAEVMAEVMMRVRQEEDRLRTERRAKGQSLLSKETSQKRQFQYIPRTFGKRMLCLCRDPKRRGSFLRWLKFKSDECRATFQQWRKGALNIPFPVGFFAPCLPRRATLLPISAAY